MKISMNDSLQVVSRLESELSKCVYIVCMIGFLQDFSFGDL